ncbi:DUF1376 domain-containing protein [Sphingomonas sp. RT2P30]|uniref:YdaU family protein n=1 Tax=Parasphingomonas halimpatiens TaxID=3096162 RepID=UPI002FCCB752
MAEFPALPLWTDAYLGDTTHLDATEHGAYLLLLICAWRAPDTTLPDDDRLLAKYARCGTKLWKRLRPVIAPFFEIRDGRWSQLRLLEEKQFVVRRRDSQAANGRASALKRKARHSTKRPTKNQPSEQPTGNHSATPTPILPLPNGNGRDAPVVDPVKALFDAGVALLTSAGISAKNARSMVGKWRKDRGDDAAMSAIAAATARSITDPVPWIEARLLSAGATADEARAKSSATAEWYRSLDMGGPPDRSVVVDSGTI